jgi:hypothetical protein
MTETIRWFQIANQQQSDWPGAERSIDPELGRGRDRFRYRGERRVRSPREMVQALSDGPGFRLQSLTEVARRAAERKILSFESCSRNLLQEAGKLEGGCSWPVLLDFQ